MDAVSDKFLEEIVAVIPGLLSALLSFVVVLAQGILGVMVMPFHEPNIVNFIAAAGWLVMVFVIVFRTLCFTVSFLGGRRL